MTHSQLSQDTMNRARGLDAIAEAIPEAIFDSITALDTYLEDVRQRREQRRHLHASIERLQLSLQKVTEELDATLSDGDEEIASELQYVREQFEHRLNLLLIQRTKVSTSVKLDHHLLQNIRLLDDSYLPGGVETENRNIEITHAVVSQASQSISESVSEYISESIRSESIREDEALDLAEWPTADLDSTLFEEEEEEEEEPEKLLNDWFIRIEALNEDWLALDTKGLSKKDKSLNRPVCFQVRALVCKLAQIYAEAAEAGLEGEISADVTQLRNKIDLARAYADDKDEALPFEEAAWNDPENCLSHLDWEEVTPLYEGIAEAQEAWDWYDRHAMRSAKGAFQSLLNSIGAAQQMLSRTLDELSGCDELHVELYQNLLSVTGSPGYLSSLNTGAAWKTLETQAKKLPDNLAKAKVEAEKIKQEAENAKEKREKEQQKEAAIKSIVQWRKKYESDPTSEETIVAMRKTLTPLLDKCITVGVPATNVEVRGALLDCAKAILADLPAYKKFLDAVVAERKRKGLDALPLPVPEEAEEEDLPDAQVAESVTLVRMAMEGQSVLILGGTSRNLVAQKLKDLLGCREVEWPDSKKGDRMNKFKASIERSDVVVIIKNFASHEMTEKSRDWSKELGKQFVLLPGGYGVNQIIHQMRQQLVDGGSKIVDIPAPKPGIPRLNSLKLTGI